MIDFNIITPCLFNVLGWKNTNDTCEKPLNPAIFVDASETGMYYNLNSELLTLPNLQAIAPNSDLFDYDNWIGGVGYSAGDIIRYDKILYKSLVDSNFGNIPSTSPNDWVLLYDFSDWLQNFTNTTILRFAQSIVNLKKNRKKNRNPLQEPETQSILLLLRLLVKCEQLCFPQNQQEYNQFLLRLLLQ